MTTSSVLPESEEHFRSLIENVSDVVTVLDQEGAIRYQSPSLTRVLGYQPEELVGRQVFDHLHPEDVDRARAALAEGLRAGTALGTRPLTVELRFRHRDGSWRRLEAVATVRQDAAGQLTGIITSRDITERRKTEEELERLAAVVRHTDELVNLATLDGQMIFLNEAGGEMLGIDPAAAAQHSILEVIPEDMKGLVHSELLPELMKGRTWKGELRYRNLRDGTEREVHATTFTVQDPVKGGPLFLANVSRDLTRHKQAERALRASEAKYRRLVEHSNDAIFVAQEGRIKSPNPRLAQLTGYPLEELVDHPFSPFIHPDDAEMVFRRHQERLSGATGLPSTYSFRVCKKDGAAVWVELSTVVIEWEGRPATLNFLRDTTERRQKEDRFRRITDCLLGLSSDFVRNVNQLTALAGGLLGGTCALYNRLEERCLRSVGCWQTPPGYRAEDRAEGHICTGVIEREERFVYIPNLPDTQYATCDPNVSAYGLRTYMGHGVRLRGKHVGSVCVVFQHDVPPSEEARQILGIVAAAIESEEERQAVLAERQRLATAIDQAGESFIIADRQGVIEYVNPACERISGYCREEVLGQSYQILLGDEHPAPPISAIAESLDAGRPWAGRLVSRRKDGSPLTEDCTISPVVDANGLIERFVVVKKDVTAELGLQEQLWLAQKMEAVGRLAGGVAHDFNNLLTAIDSYAQFAVEHLSPVDPLHADMQEVRVCVARAASLTRQLLAFGRKQMLRPVVLDLNHLVGEMQDMLRRLLGEDIRLAAFLAEDLGRVKADRGQVEQVIMNLAVNARDAMPGGGSLTLSTLNVELDEAYAAQHVDVAPGLYVLLSVSDTGMGIDAETRTRIFEPFFTTKGKRKGTGLGLSTVYGIVKQSGGNIWVYSEPGRGTTFKVYLPRVDGPADEVRPPPTAVAATGSETILLVEDEELVRRVAERILSAAGYRVLVAANAGEALLLAEKHGGAIHLLLTDVVMPHVSGRDLADRLTSGYPGLKVVFMSGYADATVFHHGVLDHGAAFIAKPFSAADLTRRVREVLDEVGASMR